MEKMENHWMRESVVSVGGESDGERVGGLTIRAESASQWQVGGDAVPSFLPWPIIQHRRPHNT